MDLIIWTISYDPYLQFKLRTSKDDGFFLFNYDSDKCSKKRFEKIY